VLRATASLAGRDAAQDGALCAAEAAREERILRLVAHANVVGLHATARHSDALVLEWCGADLAQVRYARVLGVVQRSLRQRRRLRSCCRAPGLPAAAYARRAARGSGDKGDV
jgi:hypothetical protein